VRAPPPHTHTHNGEQTFRRDAQNTLLSWGFDGMPLDRCLGDIA
jgi:hypothetical protein